MSVQITVGAYISDLVSLAKAQQMHHGINPRRCLQEDLAPVRTLNPKP